VVEATSGNTGIALAMVCAARGYRFVAFMAETFSIERRKLMRAYGAKVILTPAAERGSGMVRRAEALAEAARLVPRPPVREPGQPRPTTADHRPRDPARLRRPRLDWFVTGWGTGGTADRRRRGAAGWRGRT
jgi:cysteine synthase